MKQLNISTIISSIILGLSIVTSGFIIGSSWNEELNRNESNHIENNPLMTIEETAEYLNLSEPQIRTIISYEETMLKTNGSYTGKMFPVIRIGNDTYISTDELKEWIKESTSQRKQY